MMKEILTLTLCSMLALPPSAGGSGTPPVDNRPAMGSQTEISNPFVEYDTLEAAGKAAGFEMTAPEKFGDYTERTIRAMKDQMIEVIYSENAENGAGSQIRIRKAAGTGDISGDYNSYPNIQEVEMNGLSVIMKGDGETIKSVVWTENGYAFSVSDSIGMINSDMQELIHTIK